LGFKKICLNVARRVNRHNGKPSNGAKYPHSRRPVKLVASCRGESKSAAYSLEHMATSKARSKKLAIPQRYAANKEIP
jgi:predicted GIY-YIG superfamily endonuclease